MDSQEKILLTAFDFYPNTGGVSTYAWEVAESLGRRGYSVTVIAKMQKAPAPNPKNFSIYWVPLPQSGVGSILSYARHLRRLIKQWQPDKILCTLWLPDAVSSLFAKRVLRANTPIYTIVHGMEILEPAEGWKGWVRRQLRPLKYWVFNRCSHIFAVSHFSQSLAIEHTGVDPKKISVVPNGVNIEKFAHQSSPTSDQQIFEDRYPVCVTVSRLVPHKGIDITLQAIAQIRGVFPKLKYLIGGTGPDRRRLEALVDDLKLRSHVEFLGYVPEDDMPDLYRSADLFILLSRQELTHVEGFGLVFLEAAACGTASLGGRSGGIPDAILEKRTGWLADPNDPSDVARQLKDIFKSPEIAESMGHAAYTFAKNNRTWDHVAESLLQSMETPS